MAGMNGQVEVRVRSVPSTSGRIQRFTGQVKNTNAVLLFTAADFDRTIQVGEYITLQIIKPVKDGLEVAVCSKVGATTDQIGECAEPARKRSYIGPL